MVYNTAVLVCVQQVVEKMRAVVQEILECAGSTFSQLASNITLYCVSTKEHDLVWTPATGLTDSRLQMLSHTLFNKVAPH